MRGSFFTYVTILYSNWFRKFFLYYESVYNQILYDMVLLN